MIIFLFSGCALIHVLCLLRQFSLQIDEGKWSFLIWPLVGAISIYGREEVPNMAGRKLHSDPFVAMVQVKGSPKSSGLQREGGRYILYRWL